ncbi:hypothetical protein [Clostridium sp. C8-1-8]|uniref:hypothetical protein n=1 Tax=Clostridium sp. C8-1-8 TaxID=2698831 RepID=UPI00136F74B6|nr:hypothetical protein [Clostridium sp. C8-1-8]
MSIGVFGVFHISENYITSEKMTDLSYFIAKRALDSRFWVNQGTNVSERTKYYINKVRGKNELEKVFELTDNPMDSNAECLFGADGIEIYVCGNRLDSGESLTVRMSIVQEFFKSILRTGDIIEIELYINIEPGDEYDIINVEVDNFCEVLSEVYKNEDGWTPSIKILMK